MKKAFGRRLLEARQAKQLTQEELGGLVGLAQNTIHNYEAGRIPDMEIVEKLAQALGVDAYWLLTGKQNEAQEPDLESRWPLLSPEHREKAAKLAEMPGASIPSDATDDIIDILWAAVQTAITVTGAVTKKAAPKGGSLQEED